LGAKFDCGVLERVHLDRDVLQVLQAKIGAAPVILGRNHKGSFDFQLPKSILARIQLRTACVTSVENAAISAFLARGIQITIRQNPDADQSRLRVELLDVSKTTGLTGFCLQT